MRSLATFVIIFSVSVSEVHGVGSVGGYDDLVEDLADINNNVNEMREFFSSSLTSIDGEY